MYLITKNNWGKLKNLYTVKDQNNNINYNKKLTRTSNFTLQGIFYPKINLVSYHVDKMLSHHTNIIREY